MIVEDKASRLSLRGATLLRRGSLTAGNAVAEQNMHIAQNRDSHIVRAALLRMTEQAYHGNLTEYTYEHDSYGNPVRITQTYNYGIALLTEQTIEYYE